MMIDSLLVALVVMNIVQFGLLWHRVGKCEQRVKDYLNGRNSKED